ncbi:MAG: neutral/alkaline non-lysosomal ceramidase N-terminal domain-containing protein [Planctomycetes bacterium]|nr:neutral/alkaline non-lysosomal ceramidase N-terminal domain-containing protein [Planctomycetota bacterium]
MGDWKAGFAKRDVTPHDGVPLGGYGLQPERTAAGVLDPLFARAIVFDDGTHRAAVVSVDIMSIDDLRARDVRQRIEAATGIPQDAVWIACTHSHSTPTASWRRQWGAIEPAYVLRLEAGIVEAAVEAARTAQPVEIGYGSTQVYGVAVNRVREGGPVDQTLRLFSVRQAASGTPLVAGALFACHPVCMKHNNRCVSADFPGRLVRDLEKEWPGANGVFFQGASGDINPRNLHTGVDTAQDHGRALSLAACEAWPAIRYQRGGELRFARASCELPLDWGDAEREARAFLEYGTIRKGHQWLTRTNFMQEWANETLALAAAKPPQVVHCEVFALRVGSMIWLGLPAEVYTLIADAVREAAPDRDAWVLGLVNGNIAYVTDPRDYAEESYAAIMGPKIHGKPPYRPESWRLLADAAIAAMKEVAGG